jgi:D-alanyl-D-alanine carboxypeptidase
MSRAAKAEGVSLLVSSAYRSYEYQKSVFARNVAEMGEKEALRVSAPPGASQHQLGTAMDFGSITDAFAETAAGKWLTFNAASFGFSLSFPKDMEAVTGYRWESWHYRFIGKDAVTLQNEYFGGIQQYLMLFLDALPPER